MDILDIILARALTPQGQIEGAAAKAQQAVAQANSAVETVNSLLDNIDSLTEQTETNNQLAADSVEQVTEALSSLDTTISDMNDRIDTIAEQKTDFVQTASFSNNDSSAVKTRQAIIRKNNVNTTYDVVKNYTAKGQNEDGSMTQKAITNALNELDQKIMEGGVSGDISADDSGRIVVVNDSGNIAAGDITEESIIRTQLLAGTYTPHDTKGIEINYTNRSYSIIYNTTTPIAAITGRKCCNVANNGTINAFYGDANYREDGSNGQVMVYQPKFYYLRFPTAINGTVVEKEIIAITSEKQAGFKLHPAFIDKNGNEIEYVLLSAYEGCTYSSSTNTYNTTDAAGVNFNADYLASIADAKPISGLNNDLNIINAEKLAANRGDGWHISTLMSESINQILMLIESGILNGQEFIESGITSIENLTNKNCASLTGSTATLGNNTGAATSTINERNGQQYTYSDAGKRAIRYRGVENPWGNIFKLIGGALIAGDGTNSGSLYICTNYQYSFTVTDNYKKVNISLPTSSGWISKFGYDENFDWLFIPAAAGTNNASSSRPVGDYVYVTNNLNGTNMVILGGHWGFQENDGPYFYGLDQNSASVGRGYGARLFYQPMMGTIHNTNVTKWRDS